MLLRLVVAIYLHAIVIESVKLDRCELARLLKDRDVSGDDLQKFICLANDVGDTSKRVESHHGVFRISSDFWCSRIGSGNGCKTNCGKFVDNDLKDDVACALTIFKMHKNNRGDGFSAWGPWLSKCIDVDGVDYLSECNLSEGALLDIFVRFGGGTRRQ